MFPEYEYQFQDLKKPWMPLSEEGVSGCLTFMDGALTYYINRRCRSKFLWDLWCCYAWSPYGEDPSLWNDFYATLTNEDLYVGYSEMIVVPDQRASLRDQDFPKGYKNSGDRLDFYVTKNEFKKAFHQVRRLGHKERCRWIKEVTIFGCLRVVLLRDMSFGDVQYPHTVREYEYQPHTP